MGGKSLQSSDHPNAGPFFFFNKMHNFLIKQAKNANLAQFIRIRSAMYSMEIAQRMFGVF